MKPTKQQKNEIFKKVIDQVIREVESQQNGDYIISTIQACISLSIDEAYQAGWLDSVEDPMYSN